ncbi:MAG: prephenate dehydrogenase [Bernardetiaceae bacterium]|jgi:prephenate dehydrogenase|nr:prephenate dehydrogenase [Bernardetiaceae bacterium]
MKICIVGLGLLGGSFALGLRQQRTDLHFIGVDKNFAHAQRALELGLVDATADLYDGVTEADLTVLAVPVDAILGLLPQVMDWLPPHAVLTDLGSTKQAICQLADQHPKRPQYVALHPISGTENSGPEAAFAELMPGKIMIFCDVEKSQPAAVQLLEGLCTQLGMRLRYLSSPDHDRHLAYVSHLSHVLSYALSLTVLDKEDDEKNILDMAGSGFASTVRLAKSAPEMWVPIFDQNRDNLSVALGSYIQKLQQYKDVIDQRDTKTSHELIARANDIRRVLAGIEKRATKH